MLYSLNYTKNRRKERRLFYADSDEEAMCIVKAYAERNNLLEEYIRVEEHPKGFYIAGRLFPRNMPAQEQKRNKNEA